MLERVHGLLTIILYVVIFISPAFLFESVTLILDMYYADDRIDEFLEEAADGISVDDYLTLSDISGTLGMKLSVNVTTPEVFLTDAELRDYLSEHEEFEIIPNTFVEVYLENNTVFRYGSRVFTVSSGAL